MEFDILNDILYTTVSNLFANKEKHLKHFIKFEDNYKSEIPRSSKKIEFRDKDININQSNSLYIKENKEINQILYENWKQKESKKRLEEAIRRLNLDENKAKVKNLTNFSIEYLNAEKGKVKNELKKYDNEFNDLFFRQPNRIEKEIMRPIYLYYKNLKSALDFKKKVNPQNQTQSQSQSISSLGQGKDTFLNEKVNTGSNIINNNYIGNVNKSQSKFFLFFLFYIFFIISYFIYLLNLYYNNNNNNNYN
jgi:hypothetical protein